MQLTKRAIFIAYINVLLVTALVTVAVIKINSVDSSAVEKRQQFYDPVDLSCTSDAKCGENGDCLPLRDQDVFGERICICRDGFTNFDGICDYQRKPQFNAFLASFFGGSVGADWFYLYSRLAQYVNGRPELGLTEGGSSNGGYIVAGIFKLLTGGGFSIWWLVDWIRVITMTFHDANSMRLYENLTDTDL